MGARLSRAASSRRQQLPLYATESAADTAPVQVEEEPSAAVRLHLTINGEHVSVKLAPCPVPKPSISEDDLLVRVQLQESYSPASGAIHLILLPTSVKAQGELSHDVASWLQMRDNSAVGEEQTSKRPRSRLMAKRSPHKAVPELRAEM